MDAIFDVTINIDKLFRVLTQAQKDELQDHLKKERQNLTTQKTLREKLLDAARDSRPDDNVTLSLSYVAIDQVELFKYTNTSFSGGEWHRRLVDRQIVVTVPVYSPYSAKDVCHSVAASLGNSLNHWISKEYVFPPKEIQRLVAEFSPRTSR